jgi:hypothetical protein
MNSEILWRLGQTFNTDKFGIAADEQDARLWETLRELHAERQAQKKKERGEA